MDQKLDRVIERERTKKKEKEIMARLVSISATTWEVEVYEVQEVRGGFYWVATPKGNCGCLEISQTGYCVRKDLAKKAWEEFASRETIKRWTWGSVTTPKVDGRKAAGLKRKSKKKTDEESITSLSDIL
jgi:hypothetical protein